MFTGDYVARMYVMNWFPSLMKRFCPRGSVVAFHASSCDGIDEFWPMTHFGTREAALDRIEAKRASGEVSYLYECRIHMPKPACEVADTWSPRPAHILVGLAEKDDEHCKWKPLRLRTWELQELEKDGIYLSARRFLSEELLNRGFRVFKYLNGVEGDESDYSYLVLDPRDVKILSIKKI